ncbi:MAG: hypothetical protein WAT21_04170 [Saprospiraceae bacterium]|nr:hypothetical protein [Saprospiraceae bacterium]
MKNLTLPIFLIIIFQLATAQEIKLENKKLLGGLVNYFTQKNTYPYSNLSINSGLGGIYSNSPNDTKNTTFALTPYFGKEVKQSLIVGLQLDFRIGRYTADDIVLFGQTNPVNFERNSNQIGIGIFTRHILYPNNLLSFYIQPYFNYNLLNEEEVQNSNISQEEKVKYFEVGVGLGILYKLNSKIRATLRTGGLNYVNGKWEIKNTEKENNFSSFGTNINLSTIFFGFEILI